MLVFIIISTLIFHLSTTTSALECLSCVHTFDIDSSEVVNTSSAGCRLESGSNTICTAMLQITYEKKEATTIFSGMSDEVLILTNQAKIVTNSVMIWLNKNKTLLSLK